ncbi:Hypothetical predicted protein [Octopus vulgaris]|uniref:Centromere protein O n=1 Tax=Octopus vulgaris TaxID=6645 RepID=A0AA36BU50_OCTVU|nr:Hypothetical predicted protein [Octopus vulgaris]
MNPFIHRELIPSYTASTTDATVMAGNSKKDIFSFFSKADRFETKTPSFLERKCLQQLQKQLVDLYQKCEEKRLELAKHIEEWYPKSHDLDFSKMSMLTFDHQRDVYNRTLRTYELLGLKVTSSTDNDVHIQFQVTQNGKFYHDYFIEIFQTNNGLETKKYNLLPFIPVEKILSKHKELSKQSTNAIIKEISDYVYAFNVRDIAVQTSFSMCKDHLLNSIQYSVARDMITFVLSKENLSIDCSLSYMNLLAVRPDEISVQCSDLSNIYSKEWLTEFQEFSGMSLAKLSLPEAICSILSSVDVSNSNIFRSETNETSSD